MKLDRPYWRWSSDTSVIYVEFAYRTRFLHRLKVKRIATFFAGDWNSPTDARRYAESFVELITEDSGETV